jgi:hypothetical protein
MRIQDPPAGATRSPPSELPNHRRLPTRSTHKDDNGSASRSQVIFPAATKATWWTIPSSTLSIVVCPCAHRRIPRYPIITDPVAHATNQAAATDPTTHRPSCDQRGRLLPPRIRCHGDRSLHPDPGPPNDLLERAWRKPCGYALPPRCSSVGSTSLTRSASLCLVSSMCRYLSAITTSPRQTGENGGDGGLPQRFSQEVCAVHILN